MRKLCLLAVAALVSMRAGTLLDAVNTGDLQQARQLLAAGADPKEQNRYGFSPLSIACTNGDGEAVKLLLAAGASPNTTLPGGESVLMTAARTGKPEPVDALLKAGADPNAVESHGQTALMWAAAEGNVEAVNLLLAAKARLNAQLPSGYNAWFFAVREGRTNVVDALLQAGVPLDAAIEPRIGTKSGLASGAGGPRAGTTALALAVLNCHFELAAKLLALGASPNAAGPGFTPLHAITWVRKSGLGDNDPAPQGSGNLSSLELVKLLVAKGAGIDARMSKKINVGLTSLNTVGATAFFLASRTADAELMRLLAELGADPLLPNADGSTPLMAVAGLGTRSPGEDAGTEAEVVEALELALKLGNDPNAIDKNGETAMHGAAYRNHPLAVEYLAAHGAKIEIWNRKNKQGWTPLTIAEGYRFGNFKPSPETIAAFHKIMGSAPNGFP